MKRHFIGICLLAYSTLWAQQTNPVAEAMDRYDYETAIQLIDQQPATPNLLFQKAKAQKGLYRYNDAVATLKAVATAMPDNEIVFLELAECCRLAGNFNDAFVNYEKVLALNPTHQYARIQYINQLFMVDKYREAKKLCSELLTPDSAVMPMRLMAQCYEGMQEVDSATVLYTKVLEKDPADFIATNRLGNIHIQDNPEMTVAITEKYRELDENNLFVNRLNAQAHCLAKNYKTSIERYEHLMSLGDSTRYNTFYLGMAYFIDEKFFEAHDYLEIALKHDPQNVNILYYLGRACANTSWKKEGIEYLKQAIEISTPKDENMAKLYAGLGECCMRAGDGNGYLEALFTQRKYEPNKKYILYRIGSVYMDYLKDNKNAEKYLTMYLETRPQKTEETEPAMEGGDIVIDDRAAYRAAERRLEAIREDNFFRGSE